MCQGLAALLVQGLSGCRPEEIVNIPPEFISNMGLSQSLTPSRNNGFLNMFRLMQARSKDLVQQVIPLTFLQKPAWIWVAATGDCDHGNLCATFPLVTCMLDLQTGSLFTGRLNCMEAWAYMRSVLTMHKMYDRILKNTATNDLSCNWGERSSLSSQQAGQEARESRLDCYTSPTTIWSGSSCAPTAMTFCNRSL